MVTNIGSAAPAWAFRCPQPCIRFRQRFKPISSVVRHRSRLIFRCPTVKANDNEECGPCDESQHGPKCGIAAHLPALFLAGLLWLQSAPSAAGPELYVQPPNNVITAASPSGYGGYLGAFPRNPNPSSNAQSSASLGGLPVGTPGAAPGSSDAAPVALPDGPCKSLLSDGEAACAHAVHDAGPLIRGWGQTVDGVNAQISKVDTAPATVIEAGQQGQSPVVKEAAPAAVDRIRGTQLPGQSDGLEQTIGSQAISKAPASQQAILPNGDPESGSVTLNGFSQDSKRIAKNPAAAESPAEAPSTRQDMSVPSADGGAARAANQTPDGPGVLDRDSDMFASATAPRSPTGASALDGGVQASGCSCTCASSKPLDPTVTAIVQNDGQMDEQAASQQADAAPDAGQVMPQAVFDIRHVMQASGHIGSGLEHAVLNVSQPDTMPTTSSMADKQGLQAADLWMGSTGMSASAWVSDSANKTESESQVTHGWTEATANAVQHNMTTSAASVAANDAAVHQNTNASNGASHSHAGPLAPVSDSVTATSALPGIKISPAPATFSLPTIDFDINIGKAAAYDPESGRELINEVWEIVDKNYLDARGKGFNKENWAKLRDEMLQRDFATPASARRAVREMLQRGVDDRFSRYLTAPELDTMRKYDITGVGLNLGTADEFRRRVQDKELPGATGEPGEPGVWVIGSMRGSVSDIAGIKQGYKLLEVGGVPVKDESPFQVAAMIRGQGPGTLQTNTAGPPSTAAGAQASEFVALKVLDSSGVTQDILMQRPSSSISSPVSYKLEARGGSRVGYIRLSNFNARAQPDVAAAIQSLSKQGANEFVLDLRDNRGGLVNQGVEVAKLFLASDAVIVQQQGARATSYQTIRGSGTALLTSAPLTVLVNEETASASEILAGALHDNCRALLVGKQTYGKGLIQSVYELSDSSGLVITVGKYVTPNGTDIDREGIKPDFNRVPAAAAAEQALQACRVQRR